MVSPMLVNGRRFFWNIDGHVGLKAPNIDDDVQLVQLGYHFRSQQGLGTPAEREASGRVRPGDLCTGNADDPLVRAIIAHQKARGGAQDGRVSPISSKGGYTDGSGTQTHMLTALCNNIMDGSPDTYPRLDKLGALCPSALTDSVVDACTNPPAA